MIYEPIHMFIVLMLFRLNECEANCVSASETQSKRSLLLTRTTQHSQLDLDVITYTRDLTYVQKLRSKNLQCTNGELRLIALTLKTALALLYATGRK
jgi:hypothetical protein